MKTLASTIGLFFSSKTLPKTNCFENPAKPIKKITRVKIDFRKSIF